MTSFGRDITNLHHAASFSSAASSTDADKRVGAKRKKNFDASELDMVMEFSEFTPEDLAELIGTDENFTFGDIQAEEIPLKRKAPSGTTEATSNKLQKRTVSSQELTTPEVVRATVQTLVDEQEAKYGDIRNCGLLLPIQVKFAKVGFKCPILRVQWEKFEDIPFFEFCNELYFSESIAFQRVSNDERPTFCNNGISVLTGRWLILSGEEDQSFKQPHTFYAQSSCIRQTKHTMSSKGLYLDVSGTIYQYLHDTIKISEDEEESNCQITSVFDVKLQCEILMVNITRSVEAGERLILEGLHKHPFQLNTRGHGRKLTWFDDIRRSASAPGSTSST